MIWIKLHVFSTQIIYIVTLMVIIFNHCQHKRIASKPVTVNVNTRWFKYDRDYLYVNKSQFVQVIWTTCTLFFLSFLMGFCFH
jgi:hypothetical protein